MRLIPGFVEGGLKKRVLESQRMRARIAWLGGRLNTLAYRLSQRSRAAVRFMNHHVTNPETDWFVHDLPDLHRSVDKVLERQRRQYGSYYYFYGHPYQALGILGIYGERPTEERFEIYRLRDVVGPDDRVLDIGCNCGFMALYTSFRTGCHAMGVDINPYMIEIGALCAEYLRLDDRVKLYGAKIQDFRPDERFTVVFSFATHWTDDENYRVPLREHFERCAAFLAPGGTLVFETHAADVGNAEFYAALETMDDLFEQQSMRDTDRGTRHLYIFRRR